MIAQAAAPGGADAQREPPTGPLAARSFAVVAAVPTARTHVSMSVGR